METADLRSHLAKIQAIPDADWMASLDERKRKELEFHDQHRDRTAQANLDQDTYERFYGNRKYYAATSLSKDYVDAWIASNAKGKVFLDYACGNGVNAIKAAKAGAKLAIGLDISRVSVENARADAAAAGVSQNSCFVQADAENTQLPDGSIDAIICSGMLHHLDLQKAFPELERVLAPGGRILAVEALDYNPIIKLYRWLTPAMRTEWEKAHILSLKDVRYAGTWFDVRSVKYWHLTSIVAPSSRFLTPLLPILNFIDTVLMKIPGIRLMAWIFTFEMHKRAGA